MSHAFFWSRPHKQSMLRHDAQAQSTHTSSSPARVSARREARLPPSPRGQSPARTRGSGSTRWKTGVRHATPGHQVSDHHVAGRGEEQWPTRPGPASAAQRPQSRVDNAKPVLSERPIRTRGRNKTRWPSSNRKGSRSQHERERDHGPTQEGKKRAEEMACRTRFQCHAGHRRAA